MSEELVQTATEWGSYLAGLDEKDRDRAVRAARQALAAQLPDDEVGKPPVRTLGEYLDAKIELPPILVKPGLVARGAITAMIARGGKGKTALSLNRLVRWSMGKPLFDQLPELMAPDHPLRILVIENEGSPGHFQKVLNLILNENTFSDSDKRLARDNLHVWGDGGWSGLKLDNPENIGLVRRGVELTKADIVFVEPFRGLWKGDENSSTDMSNVMDAMSDIANTYECAVLLTHHMRKSSSENDAMDAARGSGVLEGAAAVMEQWLPVKSGRQRELSWIKARFDEAPAPVRMKFERHRWGYEWVAEDQQVREVVGVLARYPEQYMPIADIAEELEESNQTTRRWLKKAEDEGAVKMKRIDGTQRYRRTAPKDDQAEDSLSLT